MRFQWRTQQTHCVREQTALGLDVQISRPHHKQDQFSSERAQLPHKWRARWKHKANRFPVSNRFESDCNVQTRLGRQSDRFAV